MNGVILDAGEGKRLRPLTRLKPKCLLKLNDVTILEHQLINLIKCGIRNVVIVVGYHDGQIFEGIKNNYFDLQIEFMQNPIYYKTNARAKVMMGSIQSNVFFTSKILYDFKIQCKFLLNIIIFTIPVFPRDLQENCVISKI